MFALLRAPCAGPEPSLSASQPDDSFRPGTERAKECAKMNKLFPSDLLCPMAVAGPEPCQTHGPATGYLRPTDLAERPRPTGRRPAADLDEPPVRVTVYLRKDQYIALRTEAAARLGKSIRCDVSQLVREAVDAFLATGGPDVGR
jgi:hypothetical protein